MKVGIEEFLIEEADVQRVLRAMQTDDIVMLACGAFRGHSIKAIIPVEETPDVPPTREEITEKLRANHAKGCQICKGKAVQIVRLESGERRARLCSCQDVEADVEEEMKKVAMAVSDTQGKVKALADAKKI